MDLIKNTLKEKKKKEKEREKKRTDICKPEGVMYRI